MIQQISSPREKDHNSSTRILLNTHYLDIKQSIRFKRLSDMTDAAIHHVAWSDNICACFGVGKRLSGENFFCRLIKYISIFVQ
ncbi:Uncharacterised protein [Klebsiella pneumoniae]|uniref:Uncharacterized protein n=1 Tax=Klebsiella pneumoniae TaxID=573 RepID=A0A377XCD7_KLEPN|nr:Uncharacterised protein [Klebsiella pneumoniae]